MLPRRAARQKQYRDVRAPYQEQQQNRSEQQVEGMAQPLHEVIIESLHLDTELLREMGGGLFRELLQQGLQFRVRGCMRHPRPEPDEWIEFDVWVTGDLERKIDVRVCPGEAGRQHPDDRVVLMHELERPAHGTRVRVEVALPEPVAQNHHRLWILTFRSIGGDQRPTV